jgi:hypothetical protein
MGANDIKPAYLPYSDSHNTRSIDYISSPYYTNNLPKPTVRPTKILLQESSPSKGEDEKLLKTECRTIKTEDCRTLPGHNGSSMLNAANYDSYMNHDSNSSSVSSMDTLNQQNHQYPIISESHLQAAAPHNVHTNSSSVYPMLDEKRLLQQHHQAYDANSMAYNSATAEDMYQQHDRAFTLGNINRPVPSYSNEMMCGYDGRTSAYDTNAPYDRYESSPAQPCPDRYPGQYGGEQNVASFHHHQQQSHLQPTIKSDQCQHHEQQNQNTTPVYPR